MQVVEYVMPLIKDFNHENPFNDNGCNFIEVPLRFVGVDKIILRSESKVTVPTGLFLKPNINSYCLELETENSAWEEGISFSLRPYQKGKPLNLEVINDSRKPVVIFPTVILTYLLVRV